ncbi:hypothetical protein KIN20_035974 [Parelaphostrongylus tenuis]|uniref:Uncharacterized protein n=1 Tax=Parelaphostrongylus tenuis TaxID=148309 RepID=A0AAD5RCL1_PARTN|nr:hypothetical protein KIN20_035974 [Parelaphostrongylus tenuis]
MEEGIWNLRQSETDFTAGFPFHLSADPSSAQNTTDCIGESNLYVAMRILTRADHLHSNVAEENSAGKHPNVQVTILERDAHTQESREGSFK